MVVVLGIETSCDETAAAIVVNGTDVRSNVIASQLDLHRRFGGVIPELAARAHIEQLDCVIEQAIGDAGIDVGDIDAIAVTQGPGLVGALLIGVSAAKTLSWIWSKPLIAVDHIKAHANSPSIGFGGFSCESDKSPWPAVALIASGGHTSLFHMRGPLSIELLGATTDDAAGEAFDKVATILGLEYPGGPSIERAARQGNPQAVEFPRTMLAPDSLDFSFSGIKTAVLYHVHGPGQTSGGLEKQLPQDIADIAASFQQAVIDVLVDKTMLAASKTRASTVVLGGGVAANKLLRESLESTCTQRAIAFRAAPMAYCTDNAAMIAALGYHHWLAGDVASLDLDAYAQSWARAELKKNK